VLFLRPHSGGGSAEERRVALGPVPRLHRRGELASGHTVLWCPAGVTGRCWPCSKGDLPGLDWAGESRVHVAQGFGTNRKVEPPESR
jgi:hypothetical protein